MSISRLVQVAFLFALLEWLSGCGPQAQPTVSPVVLTVSGPTVVKFDQDASSKLPSGIELTLTNSSQAQCVIDRVLTSCGCAVAEPPKNLQLLPGQSTRCSVTFAAPGAGEKVVSITTVLREPKTRDIVHLVRVIGPEINVPFLIHAPKLLEFKADPLTRQCDQSFEFVTQERSGPAEWIARLSIDGIPGASVVKAGVPQELAVGDLRERRYSVQFRCAVPGSEPVQGLIRLFAADSDNSPVAEIPVWITIPKAYRCFPPEVAISLSDQPPETIERLILIQRSSGMIPAVSVNAELPEWLEVEATGHPGGKLVDAFKVRVLSGKLTGPTQEWTHTLKFQPVSGESATEGETAAVVHVRVSAGIGRR